MGYIVVLVILSIFLGCWLRDSLVTRVTFGRVRFNSRKEKKKEPDDPEKYGWLARKLHESNVRGAERSRRHKEELRQMKEHNAQLREVIRLQKEEKRKTKEEALRQREEQKVKEKERKRLLKEEQKKAKAKQK